MKQLQLLNIAIIHHLHEFFASYLLFRTSLKLSVSKIVNQLFVQPDNCIIILLLSFQCPNGATRTASVHYECTNMKRIGSFAPSSNFFSFGSTLLLPHLST
jgi:hypothetical protein